MRNTSEPTILVEILSDFKTNFKKGVCDGNKINDSIREVLKITI